MSFLFLRGPLALPEVSRGFAGEYCNALMSGISNSPDVYVPTFCDLHHVTDFFPRARPELILPRHLQVLWYLLVYFQFPLSEVCSSFAT